MAELVMLWTPTDWAKETQLRIEYINWLIEQWISGSPETESRIPLPSFGPFDIVSTFTAQGMVQQGDQIVQRWPLPYECWLVKYKGHRVTDWVKV